jgi:hypothetical protein
LYIFGAVLKKSNKVISSAYILLELKIVKNIEKIVENMSEGSQQLEDMRGGN